MKLYLKTLKLTIISQFILNYHQYAEPLGGARGAQVGNLWCRIIIGQICAYIALSFKWRFLPPCVQSLQFTNYPAFRQYGHLLVSFGSESRHCALYTVSHMSSTLKSSVLPAPYIRSYRVILSVCYGVTLRRVYTGPPG